MPEEKPEEVGGRLFFGTRPKNIIEAVGMDVVDDIPLIGTVTALQRAEKKRMFGDDVGAAMQVVKAIPVVGWFVAPSTYKYMVESGLLPKVGELPELPGMKKKGGE